MSQEEVRALFGSIGEVEACKLIKDKNTGHLLFKIFLIFKLTWKLFSIFAFLTFQKLIFCVFEKNYLEVSGDLFFRSTFQMPPAGPLQTPPSSF